MGEVERSAIVDIGPADARHAPLAQAFGAARQQPEPLDAAVLVRLVECELESEADAERRPAGRGSVEERLVEASFAQAGHCQTRRPDARQDGEIGRAHLLGFFRAVRVRAETAQRKLDGTHIAGAVRADRDLHSTPFVLGSSEPSRRTASRSARPTALHAASAT